MCMYVIQDVSRGKKTNKAKPKKSKVGTWECFFLFFDFCFNRLTLMNFSLYGTNGQRIYGLLTILSLTIFLYPVESFPGKCIHIT